MADIKNFPDVPGYVSIKQAAEMLGVTDKRIYRYIDIGRLPAYKSGGVFLLSEEDIKNFKLNPPGRTRNGPPAWRVPNTRSTILATDIYVQVQAGQQAKLVERLKLVQRSERHILPGSILRYVLKGDADLAQVHFFLVWKDVHASFDITHEQSFEAFQEELADVLDWETAQYSTNEVIIYT